MWMVEIDEDLCIGSGECVAALPTAFVLDEGHYVARVLPGAALAPGDALSDAALECPTGAITVGKAG